jgi:hypothetical protein
VFGTPATGVPIRPEARPEPTTQPHHVLSDEAPPDVALRALVDLLVERGVIDRESWQDLLRRIVRERAGE